MLNIAYTGTERREQWDREGQSSLTFQEHEETKVVRTGHVTVSIQDTHSTCHQLETVRGISQARPAKRWKDETDRHRLIYCDIGETTIHLAHNMPLITYELDLL